jgi:phosphatidylserine decarboxylase
LRLTIYGRSVVTKALVLTLLIDFAAILVPVLIIKLILLILSILLFGFVIFFFRDPVRILPDGVREKDVISPADGKVMMIEEIEEDLFLKSKAKMIGIFLSPLNVHINRLPVSGRVELLKYVRGGYAAAFKHKLSESNERTLIGITNEKFKVMFKQIAGYVARRIVCTLQTGDMVRQGEKFGMIKFGSRVDVILPVNSVIRVSVNQRVRAGLTILAEVNA